MKKIMDTMQVFNEAMKNNDYSFDIYFRIAVIEHYLLGDDTIWDLYYKMQETRCSKIKEVPETMINHKNEFIKLINNFAENGYDFEYPILLNKDGLIIDGAHRMACSIYFGVPNISVYTLKEYYDFIPADYSKEWFKLNGLDDCIALGEVQKEKFKEKRKCIEKKES